MKEEGGKKKEDVFLTSIINSLRKNVHLFIVLQG